MKLSFLISVFNESKYILECLDSIREIDDVEYEVLIVDDFSTDDTYEIVENYLSQRNIKNMFLFRNNKKGKNAAYNLAYSQAKGNYFCVVGGDDKIIAEKVNGRRILVDISIPAVSLCKLKTFSEVQSMDGLIYPRSKKHGARSGGAMLFNKTFADFAFPIPESLPNEDTWLGCIIKYLHVEVLHYPYVSYLYRQHAANSVKLKSKFKDFSHTLTIRNEALTLFKNKFVKFIPPEKMDILSSEIAVENFRREGKFIKIILQNHISFKHKISAILVCNPALYSIRKYFYRLLAGR